MRRTLVIGLLLLVSIAALTGVRARYRRVHLPRVVATADETKAGPPIPQDAAAIEKRRHDWLDWNRRTLRDAYDRVGKKDARWDEPAHKTLDLAARLFSRAVDPQATFDEIYEAARAAVDAGCVDPMVAYLYARASGGDDYPGLEEAIRRAQAAARGLAASRYPAIRRAVALGFSGNMVLYRENYDDATRKQAEHDLDAALALVEESVAHDEHNAFWEAIWLNTLSEVARGYRTLGLSAEDAYKRVDAGLARVAGAKVIRLIYRGEFWYRYGWEARTTAFAPAVPAGGFDSLEKRLEIARKAYEDAWKLQPGTGEAARGLMEIDKAVGGDRTTMERWFERAMKADGDDRTACWSKLDWLDPKWHGSADELLAFGRACRDTKNSQTGITLLVADAHFRIACGLIGEERSKYLASPDVWADIESVYDEYLKHHPVDDVARSKYATICHMSRHYRKAEIQYVALDDRLTQWTEFPYVPLDQMKGNREHTAKVVMNEDGSISFPGWHFVAGTNQDGKWKINIPVGAPHQEMPGVLGANEAHVWTCTLDGVTFGIRAVPLPPALQKKTHAQVLDAARALVASERGAQPRNVRETLLAARPAQDYYLEPPGLKPKQVRVKAIVIGSWLYELSVTAGKQAMNSRNVIEFFDSFAFKPKPKPTAAASQP